VTLCSDERGVFSDAAVLVGGDDVRFGIDVRSIDCSDWLADDGGNVL